VTVTPNEVIVWHEKQAYHYSEIGNGQNALTLHHTACASAVAALQARCAALEAALTDMLAGWKYIRRFHGDLYGVGWDRAQGKAERALSTTPDLPAEASDGRP
jgi:hypothetical protein